MAVELGYLPACFADMVRNYGSTLCLALVEELEAEGCIFVEDGNHGEYRPQPDEFVSVGVPFVRPGNLIDGRVDLAGCDRINQTAFHRVRKGIGRGGDIVVTTNATIGRVGIARPDAPVFVTNPQTTVWRSTNSDILDQRYLFCFMRSAGFQEQLRMHTGRNATFDYVSLTKQRGLTVPLPPLAEQRAIAAVLGASDDKIELNRRMNATLESMARALFQSWFVDFDPVLAKLDGRQPAGLDPDIAALFPEHLEDSPLGHTPKGWAVVSLELLASIRGGKQLPTEDCLPAGKFTVFGANGIMGYTTESTHDGFVIAFGRVGAYCGSIHWSLDSAWINNNASAVVPLQWPAFVLQTLLDIDFNKMRTGSAQPFIPNNSLASAKVLRPSPSIAEAFCRLVEPLRRQQADNDKQSRSLATLRDMLLPKLLSGELSVANASNVRDEALG